MLTPSTLRARERRQRTRLATWTTRTARLANAAATVAAETARGALTRTTSETPDGRPTIRRVRQHPAYVRAVDHLRDRQADLRAMLGDAAEDFYGASFRSWSTLIPEANQRRPGGRPTGWDLGQIRTAALHGSTPEQWVKGLVDRAVLQLGPMLARAGSRLVSPRDSDRMVQAWQRAQARQMAVGLTTWLVTIQAEADTRAARDVLRPDLLTEEARSHGMA